jgi:hypothetical protein
VQSSSLPSLVISSIAIAVARRSHSMILHVPHTINSTHVTPLRCFPVSSLHSQTTTIDLTHTVTLFSACFLTIHYESTININHLKCFDWGRKTTAACLIGWNRKGVRQFPVMRRILAKNKSRNFLKKCHFSRCQVSGDILPVMSSNISVVLF